MLAMHRHLPMEIVETAAGTMDLPEGVREGAILSGKYLIGPILGAGAMGIVVAARHLLLNEDVAIKFLVAGRWDQADAVQRFVQEARAAVRIQSEHVVRVLDVAVLEGGAPYIVMEHLRGTDLATRLRIGGPLPVDQAVDFVMQACEAISESHRIGIVHRDLKPANLFVLEREGGPPSIKVLDFGISKITRLVPKTADLDGTLESARITQEQTILGSPFYMSPEQMESARDVDARADIWALGVTLFEMVTGRPPFTGSSLVQVYSRMTSPDESGWRTALAGRPARLEAIVGRCLEWDRDRRYPNIREFAHALAPLGSRRAGVSLGRIVVSPDPSESNPGVEKAPGLTPGRAGRFHVGRNLLAAMIAGFVGSAVFVLGSSPRSAGSPPTQSATPARMVSMPSIEPPRGSAAKLFVEAPLTSSATATRAPIAVPAPATQASASVHPGPAAVGAATVARPSAARPVTSAEASPSPMASPRLSATPSSSASSAPPSFIPETIRGLLEKRE
jgi:eukaryotic-like serine/threonine-protein kinase